MTTSTTGVTWTTPVTISPYSVRVSDGPAISYNPVKDLFVVAYVDASTAKINTMTSADLSSWNSQPGHESQLAIGSPAISCSGSEERCTIAYTDLSDGARLKYIEGSVTTGDFVGEVYHTVRNEEATLSPGVAYDTSSEYARILFSWQGTNGPRQPFTMLKGGTDICDKWHWNDYGSISSTYTMLLGGANVAWSPYYSEFALVFSN